VNNCEFPVTSDGRCGQYASIYAEIFLWKRKAWFCANHYHEARQEMERFPEIYGTTQKEDTGRS
jgi:hypothetical protein